MQKTVEDIEDFGAGVIVGKVGQIPAFEHLTGALEYWKSFREYLPSETALW